MTRESLLIKIRYSFHIETMQETFYNRLDRCFIFIQIILGSAIFASFGSLPLLGAIVTVISVASFVWQPGKTAILCSMQARKMKTLINKAPDLSDEELRAAFINAEESDNPTSGLLRDAAYKRALIALGYSSEAVSITLTMSEKMAAWFAGDLPKDN
ncbi:TPA: hypothetical protein JZG45_003902 [Escherichia coli]|nr:hypothetical protein [Escherichia coli]